MGARGRLRAVIDGRLDAFAIEGLHALVAEVRGATLSIGPVPAPVSEPVVVPLPVAPRPKPIEPALDFIAGVAAFETGVSVARIRGDGRSQPDVRARTAVCWAGRELFGKSYPVIGRFLGDRDHSTILTAMRRAEKLISRDPAFRRLSEKLRSAAAERDA